MNSSRGEYQAWRPWPHCEGIMMAILLNSGQFGDIKLVVIGRQSIKHRLPAWEPERTPYDANTVSVAVSGQGSVPRLIDALTATRLFNLSGRNGLVYINPFNGSRVCIEFVERKELLYLPESATEVRNLAHMGYRIPCSSLVDELIDCFWRYSERSTTTEPEDFSYRLAEKISTFPSKIPLQTKKQKFFAPLALARASDKNWGRTLRWWRIRFGFMY